MHLTDIADTSSVSIILQTLQRTVVSTHRRILYSNGTESEEVLPLIRFSDQKVRCVTCTYNCYLISHSK